MKKELSKKVKRKSAAENNAVNEREIQELLQQEEIYKIRINALKKDELDLNVEREKLTIEKNLHIRELKRVHDEDQSRFNNNPLLKNRYVLLHLLGKGGFSEVFKVLTYIPLF
jgi:tousled-like kinase